jgi:hypothetical protein
VIKLILAGAWGVVAAFCGAYFLRDFMFAKSTGANDVSQTAIVEEVKTEVTGVPIVLNSEVQGYIIFNVSSLVDTSQIPSKGLGLAPFLADAAFRASYEFAQHGLVKIRASDIETVTNNIKSTANRKLGKAAVLSVNVEQFNFLRRDEIRGSMVKTR